MQPVIELRHSARDWTTYLVIRSFHHTLFETDDEGSVLVLALLVGQELELRMEANTKERER